MWKLSKDFFLKQTPCWISGVWTEPAQFQLFKTARCVNTLKKISVRMWIDGEQVKDKVREMTQWRCATSSSFIVVLRRMMVKVLILGLLPLKQLHALAVIITDQHSAMPFNQSIQEGPLDLKLQRPTRLLLMYTILDNTKFWLQFCKMMPLDSSDLPAWPRLYTVFHLCLCCVAHPSQLWKKACRNSMCQLHETWRSNSAQNRWFRVRCQGTETQSGICCRVKSEKL